MINDFKSKESVKMPLLVKSVLNGVTQKGAKYLSLVFQDKSGSIDGKFWDVSEAQASIIKAGHVYEVIGEVLEYNKSLQLRVNHLNEIDESKIDLNDFVMVSNVPQDVLHNKIDQALASLQNPNYHLLVKTIYEEIGSAFYQYPAAAKIHHSFLGGLATHVTGMIDVADALCKLYPSINRDLLVSGIMMHDIGKMVELSGPIMTEYTLEGKLLGHISIMQAKIMEVAKRLQLEKSEEAILLRHMVLSHHGHYEYGSPVLPMVKEAEILYLIDNLDARINTLDSALEQIKPGEFTSKLFALENRQFYKPKHQ
ncbi:MAG: HD domain-containing protein [Erysipelotrichaceae bacterium]|nr:HD domain-containing protein [Erysipelotrichaceae bacterium]